MMSEIWDISNNLSNGSFELDIPTQVRFGRGVLSDLQDVARVQMRRAVLVTGTRHAQESGLRSRVAALMGDALHTVVTVSANPTTDDVDRIASAVEAHHADGIITVGGGSVLDAAKAASVLDGRPALQLIGRTADPKGVGPAVIAIPTTGGTGAEVSRGALIVDASTGVKTGIRGRRVAPAVALVDPELVIGLPWETIVDTCFDAFAHGVEGLLARRRTAFTTPFSVAAARTAADLLFRLDRDRHFTARQAEILCAAGVFGGLSVASASTCLPHRLQQAMSGTDDSHGRGLMRLYPAWWSRIRATLPAVSTAIDSLLGRQVADILAKVHTLVSLPELSPEVDRWVAAVAGNIENDPLAPVDRALLTSLYKDSI